MSFKDSVRIGLGRNLEGMRQVLDGLTPEELLWQAIPTTNHITWILWHMARGEDIFIGRALDLGSSWIDGDWASSLRFGEDDDDTGAGWTIEQVAAMPEVSIDLLRDYHSAGGERTLAEFEKLTDPDMDRVYHPMPRWDVTGAQLFSIIVTERSAHMGQIAFSRGMQRGLEGQDQRAREWMREMRRP